ncbi:MAG TPA: hypothetical protein VIY50_05775 [Steroidobacteraceae bacterium]
MRFAHFAVPSVLMIGAVASPVHAGQPFLLPNSLIISSTTYDRTRGAVAALTIGTTLPDSDTATTAAVASNNYVEVWNNESADASFGVTSPILLSDVEPHSGHVFSALRVPADQVVTSFSSKSELALHIAGAGPWSRLVFVAYGGAGVGALDVSNSDAVPGQDPTNPVTFAFGDSFAFPRTVVAVDRDGRFSYTPTVNYGGNNGRSALLAPNGLYYTVGNANNGNAATFGASNGTHPDVTETTGLEVVKPIDAPWARVPIPAGASAEVDPLLQFALGKSGALDKPGKDDNYRGVTEFDGSLYFTKGSGSNGMDTVYTVSGLPTVAGAAAAVISVVPGFPTDSARATGGDFTPFSVFFANATTMYVTDEGTGSSTDVSAHAGLEKWSLVGGTWRLDYVLTKGLIGLVDGNLKGNDGPYPAVTTIGLRNMAGVVNDNGTVTIWAATSTSSASGDNGADPNRVVRITDRVSATVLSGEVSREMFTSIAGPTYGTAYRGVAYACGAVDPHTGVCRTGGFGF